MFNLFSSPDKTRLAALDLAQSQAIAMIACDQAPSGIEIVMLAIQYEHFLRTGGLACIRSEEEPETGEAAGDQKRNKLHATTDSLSVREEVFKIIEKSNFTIDCTVLEKSKAMPHTRSNDPMFYRYAWFYHFKHIGPMRCLPDRKSLITAASLGHKKNRATFKEAVNNVVQQIIPRARWEVSFMDSAQDPCLWVADYCAWAIQRKWERRDEEAYKRIAPKVATEFDLWRHGGTHHY